MTTGNRREDYRFSVLSPYSGDQPLGNYISNVGRTRVKIWNGGDYPTRFRNPAAPTHPKFQGSWGRRPRKWLQQDHNYVARIVDEWSGHFGYRYRNSPSSPWSKYYGLTISEHQWSPNLMVGADPWGSNDQIDLVNKLSEQVNGSDFDVGVFAAEAPKAISMIANSASAIAKMVRAMKRGNVSGMAAAAQAVGVPAQKAWEIAVSSKSLSDFFLQIKYGWLPLLQDAEGAAKYLARMVEGPVFKVKVTHRCPNYGIWGKNIQATNFSVNGGVYLVDYKVRSGVRSRSIVARIQPPEEVTLKNLLDPLTVAWEVIPFSFVVDWFIPIGNFLSAASLPRRLNAVYTMTDFWQLEGMGCYLVNGGNLVEIISLGQGSTPYYRGAYVNRVVTTSLSVPLPALKGLKSFTAQRALTSLALAGQRLSR